MKFSYQELAVVATDGRLISYLNPFLVDQQNVSLENIKALKESHRLRHSIMQSARRLAEDVEANASQLRFLDRMLTHVRFEQQDLWGFSRDTNFHQFWEIPGCNCPKGLNNTMYGRNTKYIDPSCFIHGLENS